MIRKPATSRNDKPPCFGRHPSIVFGGCLSCAVRDKCFAKFSTPTVQVLPFVQSGGAIAKAGDRRATDILLHGMDANLWAAMRVTVTKYGLRAKIVNKPPYRARVFDRDKEIVFMVMRMDPRCVIIDAKRVDPNAAKHLGGELVNVRWRSRTPVYRFTFDTDIVRTMTAQLDKLLAMSYLAGSYKPGRIRKSTP